VLKEKYLNAKALGAKANALKATVNALKGDMERARLGRSAADIANGGDGIVEVTTEEREARERLEALKQEYRATFDKLRDHKQAIEHLQKLLEQSRESMAVR
jgi:chromosome segregation ATPase